MKMEKLGGLPPMGGEIRFDGRPSGWKKGEWKRGDMRRKISGLCMAVTLSVLLLAGCGSSEPVSEENNNSIVEGEEPVGGESNDTAGVAGTYLFEESAMGGAFTVEWTLELKEDGTYALTENGPMGESVHEGSYTYDGEIVTTGAFEGQVMADFFEADHSCLWVLDGETCMPVKYNPDSTGGIPDGEITGTLPGMPEEGDSGAEYSGISYASNSSAQVCDIYLPEGEGPFPVIILIHGGGFMFGDQGMTIIQPVMEKGPEYGYAVVSVDYRKSSEAQFPGALSDVKAAVRFVRANAAEYGFDPEHIAVWGESAGAYLALMTALTPEVEELNGDVTDYIEIPSAVNAVVDFYGPVEFYTMDEEYAQLGVENSDKSGAESFESKFVGATIGENQEAAYRTYWETYKDQLPEEFALAVWIQAGTDDGQVPYTQSENFAERLRQVIGSGNVHYSTIEGADHEDALFYTDENLAEVFSYLDGIMK